MDLSLWEAALLVGLIPIGASLYAIGLWWQEAQTTWLSRLSARGLLKGHYTPHPGGGWGAPRWALRQRVPVGDLFRVQELAREPDDDRMTELWRLRSLRRKRLFFAFGPAWLIGPFVVAGTFNQLGAPLAIVVLALCSLVAAWPASRLYRRARDWGNAADFDNRPMP